MPKFGPISRPQLIRNLRALGFEGPYSGGNHQYMVRGELRLRIPNPHKGDIGRPLLADLLAQAGITREEWERL
jgi:hypothetical protein